MRIYDDESRLVDAELLRGRNIEGRPGSVDALHSALAVFITDEQLRPVIEAIDPMAMKQARDALLLP